MIDHQPIPDAELVKGVAVRTTGLNPAAASDTRFRVTELNLSRLWPLVF